jgi:predicted ATP-grasp superfamily ATP-dependent carboligase
MARVLIVGRRRKCYQAALELGHQVYLWSDGVLHESRKKNLAGYLEVPFADCAVEIPAAIFDKIRGFSLDFVVAATESSVEIAANIRERFGLPGTPLAVCNLLHDKFAMKKAARKFDIPVTDFHLIAAGDTPEMLVARLGLPLVIKPLSESGARGVKVLQDISSVGDAAQENFLAEAYVDGSEVSVETLIHQGKPIFHNVTEYLHQWKKSVLPANLEDELRRKILMINDAVIESFQVTNGMTHAEFYLTENGPVFGEMAVRPPGGYYMELIEEAYGFDPWKAYVQIETLGDRPYTNDIADKFCCVLMIHPGLGVIKKVKGKKELRKMSDIFNLKLRLNVGDLVLEHLSTSNECGHVLFSSESYSGIISRLEEIEKIIEIELI